MRLITIPHPTSNILFMLALLFLLPLKTQAQFPDYTYPPPAPTTQGVAVPFSSATATNTETSQTRPSASITPSPTPIPSQCEEEAGNSNLQDSASDAQTAPEKISLEEVKKKLAGLDEGAGPTNVVAVEQTINESAICKECHCGFRLSVTVWFHGIFGYTDEEIATLHRIANDILNDKDPCCIKVLLAVKASAGGVQATATRVTRDLLKEIKKIQSGSTMKNCLRKINYHFIGFSEGGLAAVSTAPRMPCSIEVGSRFCCKVPKPSSIPIQLDVTTIDSPFNFFDLVTGLDQFLECGASVAEVCSECWNDLAELCNIDFLSCPVAWWCSPGAENYGGRPPRCLCGRTSFHVNYQSAGSDERLKDWGFCDVALPEKNSKGEATTHNETVTMVTDEYYDQVLSPRCACNKASQCDSAPE